MFIFFFFFRVVLLVCFLCFFFLMIRRPPRSTRTDTLFPYTTLFRSYDMPLGNAAFAGVEGNIDLNTADALGIEAKWGWGVSGRAGLMVNDSTGVYGRVGYQRNKIGATRSEEHTSELQSLMRISYAVFCLKKKKHNRQTNKKKK